MKQGKSPNLSLSFIKPSKTAMSTRIKNEIGLRKKMEARVPSIAGNASGSYVLRSFDPDEFDHVMKLTFDQIPFGDEEFVVIARGPLGSLAKFARVSPDRRYARYFGSKFISVALIDGQVFSRRDFIKSIVGNPTLRVTHQGKEYIGILHGDMTKSYKTLVYLAGQRFNFLDLEEDPPPQSSFMKVIIKETNPAEGAAVKAALLALFP